MNALNKSCSVEMTTSSTPLSPRRPAVRLRALVQRHHHGGPASAERRKQRTTKKRTCRNQRRRRRSEKRACSDTIEEPSSRDGVDARRKRPPSYRKSQCSGLTHLQSDTSLHFHITTLITHGLSSNGVWYRERVHVHLTISRSFRLKPGVTHNHCRLPSVLAPLNEFAHGGCAGVRLGEARNPGPATHERDRTAEERMARQRRVNEAGDSVPGSQTPRLEFAAFRISGNADRSSSPITTAKAPLSKTYSDTGAAAATRIPSLCSMRSRSSSIQRSVGPRPQAAHGSETLWTTAHPRELCTAATSRPCRLCSL